MKKKTTLSALLPAAAIFLSTAAHGQVGINNSSPQATLDVTATTTDNTKPDAVLVPRMTLTQLAAKNNAYANGTTGTPSLQNGALVFVTDVSGTPAGKTANVTAPGFYYYDGTVSNNVWKALAGSGAATDDWLKISDNTPAGTGEDQYITGKAVIGTNATAAVDAAGTKARLTVAGGDANINSLTVGLGSGQGIDNTALGYLALYSNVGLQGNPNTSPPYGFRNTAVGYQVLSKNTTGNLNTAVGAYSLFRSTTAAGNTAVGNETLIDLLAGNNNTALGSGALVTIESGSENTSIGYNSLSPSSATTYASVSYNTSVGSYAGSTMGGNYNTVLGWQAGYNSAGTPVMTGDNNIIIGQSQLLPVVTASNQLNIGGAIFGTGMSGSAAAPAGRIGIATAPDATYALKVGGAGATGPVWNVSSDRRIKKDIAPFTDGLNVITRLKPVTFRYTEKSGYDTQAKHVGFIAQEVEEVAPYMQGC